MEWGKLDLYIGHLLPGILTLFFAVGFLPAELLTPPVPPGSGLDNPVVMIGVFLSAAYVLGVMSGLVSRMFIDALADWTLTPVFFWVVECRMLDAHYRATEEHRSLELRRHYDAALSTATMSRKKWYRQSVHRRRERAELVRTCFVPVVAATGTVLTGSMNTALSLAMGLAVGLVVIVSLFAYAESLIYQECLKDPDVHSQLAWPRRSPAVASGLEPRAPAPGHSSSGE